MTFRTIRWLVVGGILLGSVVGIGAAIRADHDLPPPSRQTVLAVETVTVDPVDSFVIRRTFTGVIKPSRASQLSFERIGKLISISVDQGDRVAEGQTLAYLDTRDLEARRSEIQAQRDAAAAVLAELQAGPRREVIEAARAEVDQLSAEAELEQAEFARASQLVRKRAISQSEYDTERFGAQAAKARLAAARQKLAELESGTRAEKLDAQQAIAAQLDAMLASLEVDLEDSVLSAPFSGTIAKRYEDPGTIVTPGMPLLRLVEDRQLEAWIGLPAANAMEFEVGTEKNVIVDGQTFVATVSAVLPELDPATRTRTVVLTLDDGATGRVFPSQVVRIEVTQRRPTHGSWVPTTALTRGTRGLWSALVVQRDERRNATVVVRRDVEVLHTEGDRALVRGTLRPGDQVVASGAHRVVPGQTVQIVSAQVFASNN